MDGNLFAGIGSMGLEGISGLNLYGDPKDNEATQEKVQTPEDIEREMLFEKSYECPCCFSTFKNHLLRTGKAKLASVDLDLHQKFDNIEPLKYDVVSCPHCGFSAVTRFFTPMTPTQRKTTLQMLRQGYIPQDEPEGIYDYEYAVSRYKLALACDVAKNARASEKAYTCLRAGWMCRTYKEELQHAEKPEPAKVVQAKLLENEFLKNAYEGFIVALGKESFPMCGMDEGTVNYLIAALAFEQGHYEMSSKMISTILSSSSANPRMKERARDLKEEVLSAMKNCPNP